MNDFQPLATDETRTYKYYVGDLCYVMHDEWTEVCNLTLAPDAPDEIFFTLDDGREFIMMSTAYGDGCYNDQEGRPYSVDSGTIGAIRTDYLNAEELADAIGRGLGHLHTFNRVLDGLDADDANGVLHFGDSDVIIDTAGDMDEDEDSEGEEEFEDEEDA